MCGVLKILYVKAVVYQYEVALMCASNNSEALLSSGMTAVLCIPAVAYEENKMADVRPDKMFTFDDWIRTPNVL